jgi:hypothetical protein
MNQQINMLEDSAVRKLRSTQPTERYVRAMMSHPRPAYGWVPGKRRPIPTSGPKGGAL